MAPKAVHRDGSTHTRGRLQLADCQVLLCGLEDQCDFISCCRARPEYCHTQQRDCSELCLGKAKAESMARMARGKTKPSVFCGMMQEVLKAVDPDVAVSRKGSCQMQAFSSHVACCALRTARQLQADADAVASEELLWPPRRQGLPEGRLGWMEATHLVKEQALQPLNCRQSRPCRPVRSSAAGVAARHQTLIERAPLWHLTLWAHLYETNPPLLQSSGVAAHSPRTAGCLRYQHLFSMHVAVSLKQINQAPCRYSKLTRLPGVIGIGPIAAGGPTETQR